jgi:GntR family transcriptional repressor for pyruvate dehydrogenase complex
VAGRTTLSQAITNELLERLEGGVYPPGGKLATEKQLMDEFDVGRNVVREAVHSLVAMGLIEVRPGRGALVTGIDSANAIAPERFSALLTDAAVDDINDFRRIIEVEIAIKAAKNATDDDLREMRVHLDEFSRRYAAGVAVTEPELEFHAAIARASGNDVYVQVLELLRDRLASARDLAATVDWVNIRAMEDHEEILKAIADHDPDAARAAMRKHMKLAVQAIEAARQLKR